MRTACHLSCSASSVMGSLPSIRRIQTPAASSSTSSRHVDSTRSSRTFTPIFGFSEMGTPHVYGPPKHSVFGGTNENPAHAVMNLDFFRDFDAFMSYLHAKGIVVHPMRQVQSKRVRWAPRRSVEDDLYWRYVVARYQAYPNLPWDVGKESFYLYRENRRPRSYNRTSSPRPGTGCLWPCGHRARPRRRFYGHVLRCGRGCRRRSNPLGRCFPLQPRSPSAVAPPSETLREHRVRLRRRRRAPQNLSWRHDNLVAKHLIVDLCD